MEKEKEQPKEKLTIAAPPQPQLGNGILTTKDYIFKEGLEGHLYIVTRPGSR